jgi:hypothetical protein
MTEITEETKTTLKLKRSTRMKLADFGKKSETFDEIVLRLLDEVETCRKEAKIGDQSPLEQAALTA